MNSSYQDTVPGFAWRDSPAGPVLEAAALSPFALNGVTTRRARFREPGIEEDYARLAAAFGVEPANVLRVRQVHGAVVVVVHADDTPSQLVDADAIVCTDPLRVASVRVADCVPVLIADERREVVAAVHAGWRGTAAGVAAEAVRAIDALGIDPGRLVAAIGPSIGPCCYQVNDDVREAVRMGWPNADRWFAGDGEGRWKLDLWTANREQLESAGVRPSAITTARLCTADTLNRFYSHRKEGAETGRMVAAIRMRG